MIKTENFGVYGKPIKKYTLSCGVMEVDVTDYGATLLAIRVPDKNGKITDVVLGYDRIEEYVTNGGYLGASIGRVANRIGGASFEYFGTEYKLYPNDNGNTLHGGKEGFDKKVWNSEVVGDSVIMTYSAKDGEEGFFGNLDVEVEFFIDENNGLNIVYTAVTDTESAVNLTNHVYFNLNGEGSGDILGHSMMINSSCITPVDNKLIPHGEFMSVEGTSFDFRVAETIGKRIDNAEEQLKFCGGYDHNYVLDEKPIDGLACITVGEKSGILMQTYTNQNGVQFYAGNMLCNVGKGGKVYQKRNGFCLEAQSYPNALNVSSYGSPVIRAGEIYKNHIIYRFPKVEE